MNTISKTAISFLVCYVFLLPLMEGQPITFNRTYDTLTRLLGVTQTADKGYFGVGFGNPEIMYAIKTDSVGNMEWQHSFTARRTSQLRTLTATQDGNVVCLGGISALPTHSSGFMPYAIKYALDGRILWERTYMPPIFPFNSLSDNIIEMPNGNLTFSGSFTYDVSRSYTDYVIQTNAQGEELWRYICPLDSVSGFIGREIDQTADSGIVMISNGYRIESLQILKLNAQGQLQWRNIFTDYRNIFWRHVLALPNGNIAVGGEGYLDSTSIVWGLHLAIFGPTGNLIRRYTLRRGTLTTGAKDLVLSRDKNSIVFLGGYSKTQTTPGGMILMRFNLLGDSLSYSTYTESQEVNFLPKGMAATDDNGFVICGLHDGGRWIKPFLLKIDSTCTVRNNRVGIGMTKQRLISWFTYPNPTQKVHQIKGDFEVLADAPIELLWTNMLGQIVKRQIVQKEDILSMQFDVSAFGKGIYFVAAMQGTTYLGTKGLIIE